MRQSLKEKLCCSFIVHKFFINVTKISARDNSQGPTISRLLAFSGNSCNVDKAIKLFQEYDEPLWSRITSTWRNNNIITMHELAMVYHYQCDVVTPDSYLRKAINLYEKAVKLNNTQAMRGLADIYRKNIKNNFDQAIKYYEMAVELNDITAMLKLAKIYEKSSNMVVKAINLYEKAVELNNITAMLRLARLYESWPNMVVGSFEKAIKCYKKAVELNNITAMQELVRIYEEDESTKRYVNKDEIIEVYKKIADRYQESTTLKPDYVISFYEKAIKLGGYDKVKDLYETYCARHKRQICRPSPTQRVVEGSLTSKDPLISNKNQMRERIEKNDSRVGPLVVNENIEIYEKIEKNKTNEKDKK